MQNLFSSSLLFKNIKIWYTRLYHCGICGCEIMLLTWKKECRLRVFENGLQKRIYGLGGTRKREWRNLHNEELNDIYFRPTHIWVIKSRRKIWVGHAARMGERRVAYTALVG